MDMARGQLQEQCHSVGMNGCRIGMEAVGPTLYRTGLTQGLCENLGENLVAVLAKIHDLM
jgi:hypothetical protein